MGFNSAFKGLIQTALFVNMNWLNSHPIKLLDYSAGIRKIIE